MQIRKLKTKMGFLVLAKHGLNKYGIKRPKLVSLLEKRKAVEREGEKRRREEGRRRRRRRGRASKAKLQKGMELLTLSRDPWFCLVNGYLLYPNLGFVRISF